MDIKLNIVPKTLPKETPLRNTYKLYTTIEHGDADLIQNNTGIFREDETDDLKKWVELLLCYWKVDKRGYPSDREVMNKELEETGKKLGIKYPTDVWIDLVGGDVTNDGQSYCALKKVWIVYYDYNGEKLNVDITINGQKTDKLNSAFYSKIG